MYRLNGYVLRGDHVKFPRKPGVWADVIREQQTIRRPGVVTYIETQDGDNWYRVSNSLTG